MVNLWEAFRLDDGGISVASRKAEITEELCRRTLEDSPDYSKEGEISPAGKEQMSNGMTEERLPRQPLPLEKKGTGACPKESANEALRSEKGGGAESDDPATRFRAQAKGGDIETLTAREGHCPHSKGASPSSFKPKWYR